MILASQAMRLPSFGQSQRIDFQKLQILLARDFRQPRRVTRQPRGKVGRKKLRDRRENRFGVPRAPSIGMRASFADCSTFSPPSRRDQKFEPLTRCHRPARRQIFRARSERLPRAGAAYRHRRAWQGSAAGRREALRPCRNGAPARVCRGRLRAICALSRNPGQDAASPGGASPAAKQHAPRHGDAVTAQQGFSVDSARRIMAIVFPAPFGAYSRSLPHVGAFAPAVPRSQPWRVAVVSPTGRYARNQVAGMLEAGTPLVAGVALGRGGTAMDGLPLYDRIADVAEKPNIALDLHAGRGRSRRDRRMCGGAAFRPSWRLRNTSRCTMRSPPPRRRARREAG